MWVFAVFSLSWIQLSDFMSFLTIFNQRTNKKYFHRQNLRTKIDKLKSRTAKKNYSHVHAHLIFAWTCSSFFLQFMTYFVSCRVNKRKMIQTWGFFYQKCTGSRRLGSRRLGFSKPGLLEGWVRLLTKLFFEGLFMITSPIHDNLLWIHKLQSSITYSEISVLRLIAKRLNYRFIFCTDGVLNGDKMLSSLNE